MAIKYSVMEDQQKVMAILDNVRFDACKQIEKQLRNSNIKFECTAEYLMPKTFKAVVKVQAPDVFDIEVGKKLAKKKVLDHYYRSLHKRVNKFVASMEKTTSELKKLEKRA